MVQNVHSCASRVQLLTRDARTLSHKVQQKMKSNNCVWNNVHTPLIANTIQWSMMAQFHTFGLLLCTWDKSMVRIEERISAAKYSVFERSRVYNTGPVWCLTFIHDHITKQTVGGVASGQESDGSWVIRAKPRLKPYRASVETWWWHFTETSCLIWWRSKGINCPNLDWRHTQKDSKLRLLPKMFLQKTGLKMWIPL